MSPRSQVTFGICENAAKVSLFVIYFPLVKIQPGIAQLVQAIPVLVRPLVVGMGAGMFAATVREGWVPLRAGNLPLSTCKSRECGTQDPFHRSFIPSMTKPEK